MSGMAMMGLEEATQKMYALYGENKKITDIIMTVRWESSASTVLLSERRRGTSLRIRAFPS